MLATAISLLFATAAGMGLAVIVSSTLRGWGLYRFYRGELAQVSLEQRFARIAAEPAFDGMAEGMGWLAADVAQVRRPALRRPFSAGAASRRRAAAAAPVPAAVRAAA